ncbi:P3 [Sauropus yellowing virus]|nr:P3 [Sauropus yellowing virus]AIY62171.1 P3 [Sauropus yellowing virus]
MNTAGRKGRRGNGKRRFNNVTRQQRTIQPVVVVTPNGQPRGRNRGRRNRLRNRGNRGRTARGSVQSETFVFNKDDLKGSSHGTIKFGPNLSESVALSAGVLKAYHEYKIVMVNIRFVSESSSTAQGSIAYELDPHCKLDALKSTLRKFPITKGGQATFRASEINGEKWHDTTVDQFRLLYKGNGAASETAGFFQIRFTVQLHNPK